MLEKITESDFVFNQVDTQKIVEAMISLYPEKGTELNYGTHFQLVCAVLLSAQTTDASVNKITPALFTAYPTAEAMAVADVDDIAQLIRHIGLYRNKAKYLKKMAQQLVSDYDGEVPAERTALESLAGVGRKTASVVLSNAFDIPAFAVDTHVKRTTQRFHMVTQDANVSQVEKQMTAKLPPDMWYQAHHSILLFGRHQCVARKHNHDKCIDLIENEIQQLAKD